MPYPFGGTSSAHTASAGGGDARPLRLRNPVDVADPSKPRESKHCVSLTIISSYHRPSSSMARAAQQRGTQTILPGSPTGGGLRGWQLRRLESLPSPINDERSIQSFEWHSQAPVWMASDDADSLFEAPQFRKKTILLCRCRLVRQEDLLGYHEFYNGRLPDLFGELGLEQLGGKLVERQKCQRTDLGGNFNLHCCTSGPGSPRHCTTA